MSVRILKSTNPSRQFNVVMVFDDIIADMISPIVTELFIKGRKLNISTISQNFISEYKEMLD